MARIASSLAAAAVLLQAASAQTVHRVDVGDGGLTYEPSELTAAVGDSVEFHFLGGFHSVARSSFDSPCTPINGSDTIFSGPITGPATDVFTVSIENEDPIWYYCATQRHCQMGMVGVINAPSSGNTLANYRSAAADVSVNEAPSSTGGGTFGPAATGSSSATGSAGAESTSAAPTSSGSGSASASGTAASASATPTGNAGANLRGEMGMMGGIGAAAAALVAGVML